MRGSGIGRGTEIRMWDRRETVSQRLKQRSGEAVALEGRNGGLGEDRFRERERESGVERLWD